MSKALAWIRKSKGSEDDVGLAEQRERVAALAEQLADDVETLDLGIHTGFSIHSRDRDDERLDANERVQEAIGRLEDGEFDYLVAWDDTRLARDQYFATIERAALLGDAELQYVADVEDGMAFEIQRTVEKEVKLNEIRKSKQALARREREGYPSGRPPFGLQYNDGATALVPGDEFDAVQEVLDRRDDGETYEAIRDATGVSLGTISRILDRRETYEAVNQNGA